MVSHLFYYQLALLAIVWLFVMLHVAGSRRGAQIPRSATPIKPRRNRSVVYPTTAGNSPSPLGHRLSGVNQGVSHLLHTR